MSANANPLPRMVDRCGGAFQFGRRNCMDRWTPAELAIWDAIQAVEMLGADVALTQAVNALSKVQDAVADWLEGVEPVEGSHLTARSDEKAPAVGVGSPVSAGSTAMEVLTEMVNAESELARWSPGWIAGPYYPAKKRLAAAWDRAKALVSAQGATR